ncbi:substrate-binding periplasmic protein [Pseudomonas sp. HK3]
MRIFYRLVTLVLGLMLASAAISATFPVYVYHDDAPYFIDSKEDLSQQWTKAFNQKQSNIKLKLVHIERPALNAIVESGKPYLILWANDLWFKHRDPDVLSSAAIFWDADTLVSSTDKKIMFNQAQDLKDLNIGVRYGHYYVDLNPFFKAGTINRVDAKSSYQNYQRLKLGKIDAFLDSRSTILYMQNQKILTQAFYVSLTPQDAFSRHVLLSKDHAWMLPEFNRVIHQMQNDQSWQATMSQWGLFELVNQFELELKDLNDI